MIVDILIYVFGALAVICGAFLSYIAFSTGLKSKESLALWTLFCTILFVITGGFIYFQKQIWERARKQPSERPILFVERVVARPLVAGHRKAVSVWLRNRGSRPARKITVWITQAFTNADFEGPLIYKPVYEPDSRFDCEPGAAVSLAGKSDSPVALWEIKALNDRKAFWFHYGKGTYEDDDGNIYPLKFCYMYEPGLGEDLRICPDRFLPKEGNEISPHYPAKRPELSLEGAAITFKPMAGTTNRMPTIHVVIRNRGALTAHNIALKGRDYLKPASFTGPLDNITHSESDTYPNLAPGAPFNATTLAGSPVTEQEVHDILTEKARFFHYTKGQYEDSAGNVYPFNFCLMCWPEWDSRMRTAPPEYWPIET